MLPPLASVADLEARLGAPLTDAAQRSRADALLSDASTLVRWEAGEDWVDDYGVPIPDIPDIAVTISLSAAIRAWYNPAQVASQQLGAASVRYGDVWLTASERNRLSSLGGTRGNVQSIDMTGGFGYERPTTLGWAPCDYNGDGASVPYADWAPIGY